METSNAVIVCKAPTANENNPLIVGVFSTLSKAKRYIDKYIYSHPECVDTKTAPYIYRNAIYAIDSLCDFDKNYK